MEIKMAMDEESLFEKVLYGFLGCVAIGALIMFLILFIRPISWGL